MHHRGKSESQKQLFSSPGSSNGLGYSKTHSRVELMNSSASGGLLIEIPEHDENAVVKKLAFDQENLALA